MKTKNFDYIIPSTDFDIIHKKHIAIEDIGNAIWKVFLGFFDEKHLRNKQQSTRLEINLV